MSRARCPGCRRLRPGPVCFLCDLCQHLIDAAEAAAFVAAGRAARSRAEIAAVERWHDGLIDAVRQTRRAERRLILNTGKPGDNRLPGPF